MKRLATFLAIGLTAVGLCMLTTDQVSAKPEYKARIEEITKNMKGADAIKEAKCLTCHYGVSKKNRNDFGKALAKHITDAEYKSLKPDKEELFKKIDTALKAAMKEKCKDGKTFGDLIQAGSLPAENPE
jgi:hypothetical protein